MRLSKSKINTLFQCPYAFKLQYIDKIQIDIIPEQLTRGIEVHEIFEWFYNQDKVKQLEKIDYNTALNILKKHEKFSTHEKYCKNFAKFVEFTSQNANETFKPKYTETKIYDKDLDFTGIIDRIDIDGDTTVVLDYKTGKKHNIKDYKFELALYKMLADKQYGINIEYGAIYFPLVVNPEKAILSVKLTEQDVKDAIATVKLARKKIEDYKIKGFPKKPSYFCKWCQYYQNGYCNGEF